MNNKSYKLSYPWLRSCVRVREKGERPPRREQGIQNTGVASCSQRTSKTDFSSHPTRSPSSISSLWPRPHRTRGDKRPCRLSSSLPPLSFGSVTALPRLPAASPAMPQPRRTLDETGLPYKLSRNVFSSDPNKINFNRQRFPTPTPFVTRHPNRGFPHPPMLTQGKLLIASLSSGALLPTPLSCPHGTDLTKGKIKT